MSERYGVFYINVPFAEKDEAKALGARWDNDARSWYYIDSLQKDKFKRWINETSFFTYNDLSDEQKELIDRAKKGDNVLVDACIGSGKTTAIQVLCNECADKSILYMTYNNLLKLDARDKIKSPNVTVTNYHGFAYMCLKNSNIPSGQSDLIQNFLKFLPRIPKIYDMIVLDEYQDIEEEIATMLNIIKESNPKMQIIAVGDMKQKIYDKTTLDVPKFIQEFLGYYSTLNFTKCFRLSEAHAAMLGRIWNKEIKGVNKDCTVEIRSLADTIDFLAVQDVADILCLGSRNGDMSVVLNYLEKNFPAKFNKQTVYASIMDEDRSHNTPKSQNAIFTTYDSSKGLERKICCVFDFTEDYWDMRTGMPMTKYEIMRNIFCVAASRGKEKIIFVNRRDKGKIMLTEQLLSTPTNCTSEAKLPYPMSDMFSFKYKEDVEECFNLISAKRLTNDSQISEIEIESKDGLIDLSPCIGVYQEAEFFEDYSIDSQLEYEKQLHPDRPLVSYAMEDSTEFKILVLTAFTTCYARYTEQVQLPFVHEDKKKELFDRLHTEFDGTEEVQRQCFMSFEAENGQIYDMDGRCDVVKNNMIYELKFVSELGHEHFLQLACYLVAQKMKKGILWNVKTNDKYEVTVPDRKKFMDAVIKTITKGCVKEYYMDERLFNV